MPARAPRPSSQRNRLYPISYFKCPSRQIADLVGSLCSHLRMTDQTVLRPSTPRPVKIRRRRRAPDVGLAALRGLRPLRRVLMPGPRLEIAEVLVHHLVELAEEFDHLIVRIAGIGGDVVPGAVAPRPPAGRRLSLAEQVAGI